MTVPTTGTKNETRKASHSKTHAALGSVTISAARPTPLRAEINNKQSRTKDMPTGSSVKDAEVTSKQGVTPASSYAHRTTNFAGPASPSNTNAQSTDAPGEGARNTNTQRSTLLPAFDMRNLPVNTGTRSMDPPPCYTTDYMSFPFSSSVRVTESSTKPKSPVEKPSSSSSIKAQVIEEISDMHESSTRPLTASESMMSVTEDNAPGPSARTVDNSSSEPFIRAQQFTKPVPQAQMSPDIEMEEEVQEVRTIGPSTFWASFTRPYDATPIQVAPWSTTLPTQAPHTAAWKPTTVEFFREGNSSPTPPVYLPQQTRYTPYEQPRLQQTAFLSQWENGVDPVSTRYQSTPHAQRALKKKTREDWPSLVSMVDRLSPEEFAEAEIRRLRIARKSRGEALAVLFGAHLKAAPARSNGLSHSIFAGPSTFSASSTPPSTYPDTSEPGVFPASLGETPSAASFRRRFGSPNIFDTPLLQDVSSRADSVCESEITISIVPPSPVLSSISLEAPTKIDKTLLYVPSRRSVSKRKRGSDQSSSSRSRSREAAGGHRRKKAKIVAPSEPSFSDTDMEEILQEDWKKKMLRVREERRQKERLRAKIEQERQQRRSLLIQAPTTHNHFAQHPQPYIIPSLQISRSCRRAIQQPSIFERAKEKLKSLLRGWT